MNKKSTIFALCFAGLHLVIVAPFVPIANILPAGLGALSMSSMALALILAARWRVVDLVMGGPDKSYVAHRWLGFFALFGMLGHWALASTVGAGVLPLLAESGEHVGTAAAIGLIALSAAAMVQAIPYHLWKASHMLMGPIFLLACYHTFITASPLSVGAAPWSLMAIVSIVGILAWGQTLLRKRAITRLVKVEKAEPFEGGIDVTLRSMSPLPDYRPGQFATIAYSHARAESHPFSIAGGDATSRRFLIRSAGDWTSEFVSHIEVGDEMRLGRGVGRFLLQVKPNRKEQLWVAGGVGITPFLAALEKMQPDQGARVTLVYCIRSPDSAGAVIDVEQHAERLPQLRLIVASDQNKNRLNADQLTQLIGDMAKNSSVYLCGPAGLKNLVTEAWKQAGMSGKIHSERFDFRGAYSVSELIYLGKPALEKGRDWVSQGAKNLQASSLLSK